MKLCLVYKVPLFKREIEQMSWEDLLPAVKEDLQVVAMISLFIYDKNILIWKIRPLVGIPYDT